MKSFIVFALLVAAAVALPLDPKDATIIQSKSNNIGVGPYDYQYETSDGIFASATGQVKDLGADGQTYEVRGQYSYTGPDNVVYTVTYIANEEGFKAEGAHIPKA